MQPTTTSLFEREMRAQVAAAEGAVLEAMGSGDPLLIEAARSHLDGLVDLARRNGLELKPLINDEPIVDAQPTAEDAVDQVV